MFRSLLFFFLLFSLLSCNESRRVITPIVPEGDRVVLLEEFTGKGCTNCPKGSREIDNLLSIYGDNLVVISIHAGLFANPNIFQVGEFDLRTEEGEQLYNYLGPIIGYPTGVVNRTKFGGGLQQINSAWAAYISQELEEDPAVELTISHNYNQNTRKLDITVSGIALSSVQGDIRMSVSLTEDGIIDDQDDQEAGGIVPDYEHKHVLRDMATSFDGESFSSQLTTGQTFSKNYSMTLDEEWVAGKCSIVAFVSLVDSGNNTFRVLQAAEDHLDN